MKAGAGAAFTITLLCALPLMDFWSPNGRLFPPRELPPGRSSQCLDYPKVFGHGALPARVERHNPHLIATLRARLVIALIARLSHCPCCRVPLAPKRR